MENINRARRELSLKNFDKFKKRRARLLQGLPEEENEIENQHENRNRPDDER